MDEAVRLSELAKLACVHVVDRKLISKVLCNDLTIYTDIGKEPNVMLVSQLLEIHRKLNDQFEAASVVICVAN